MKVYPEITGALCANSHPGSYTGQDAFNGMIPVIRKEADEVLDKSGNIDFCVREEGKLPERKGLQVREGHCSDGMEVLWKRTTASDEYDADDEHAGLHARSAIYRGGGTTDMEETNRRKYVLRRLTPLECARLQGFPDWWEDGVEGSDSARYKMWGNGIALPCAADVIGRIAKEMKIDV